MNKKYLRDLSPVSRRKILTALAASPFALAYGNDGLKKVVELLFGMPKAYAAPGANFKKFFVEINLRDQWDFMHFMVPPGIATGSIKRANKGETGEEQLCGLFQDQKTLTKAGNNFYFTDESKDIARYADNIAAVETIELCIGTIHGHEAANALRSPGRSYKNENGKSAMWTGDDPLQQDAGGDEFLYSSSPTPAIVHLNLARKSDANLRGVALKFLGRGDKKHAVYHHKAKLSDAGFLRVQSENQLKQDFGKPPATDSLTNDELKVAIQLVQDLDSNFLKTMKYTDDGKKGHKDHQVGFAGRLTGGAEPVDFNFSAEELKFWRDGVPPEASGAPRMHLWQQCAYATRLMKSGQVSTVAMEFSFDDLHGPRPGNLVKDQGRIIGLVMNRFVEKLKEIKTSGNRTLFDDTLIMLNTTDGGRSPKVDSYGDSGKNSMILIGENIKGGYYGDVRPANNNEYTYHKPNYDSGATEANGARDNGNRIPGATAYRTILHAMGATKDDYKDFPDVGGSEERLKCMLKA